MIETPEYISLSDKASDNERDVVSRLSRLNRRIYSQIFSRTGGNIEETSLPGKYLLVVDVRPPAHLENEFNKWYDKHIDKVDKVPGWIRSRRYKLVSNRERGGKADPSLSKEPCNYLALHEFEYDRDTTQNFEEMKEVVNDAKGMFGQLEDEDVRWFKLYKVFHKE